MGAKELTKNKGGIYNMNEKDREELLGELRDVQGKMGDCINALEMGKDLDETQVAFLKVYNAYNI